MDLTPFTAMDHDDRDGFEAFLVVNYLAHTGLNQALLDLGIALSAPPLAEIEEEERWMDDHASWHNSAAASLGIDGPSDLSDYDLRDADEFADFMLLHGLAHSRLNQALGF